MVRDGISNVNFMPQEVAALPKLLSKKLTFVRMLTIWWGHGDPFVYYYFRGLKVLDIGCGAGRFLEKNPSDYFGIDVSSELVDVCQRKGLKAAKASATRLPFETNSIAAIHCDNLIEHLQPGDAAAMLNEIGRVLMVGGIAMLRSPLGESVWNTFSHVRPYPPAAIQKLLHDEKEGFVRSEHHHVGSLRIGHVYYSGRYFRNRLLFALGAAWAHFIPWSRKHGYVLVLYKN